MDRRAARALALGFLIGGAVVVLILAVVGIDLRALRLPWSGWERGAGPGAPSAGAPAAPGGGRSAEDMQLLELQDVALQTLAINPNDKKALQRLIAVRRKLARDDVATLKRQAEVYRRAVAEGRSLEFYAPAALAFLAAADELAVAEIEKERRRQGGGPPGQSPAATPAAPEPNLPPSPATRSGEGPAAGPPAPATPTRAPTQRTSPAARASTPRQQALPPPAATIPPPDPTPPGSSPRGLPGVSATPPEPLFLVRIGPFASLDRALQIAAELTSSGLRAVVQRGEDPRQFLVVSEALLPDAAERRRTVLEAMGYRPRVRTLSNGLAQLELGPFTTGEAAESLARELRRRGYYGAVVPEGGTGHAIILGPHARSAVDDIVDRMRARFGTVMSITVYPAP